jgi:hypothetical protein
VTCGDIAAIVGIANPGVFSRAYKVISSSDPFQEVCRGYRGMRGVLGEVHVRSHRRAIRALALGGFGTISWWGPVLARARPEAGEPDADLACAGLVRSGNGRVMVDVVSSRLRHRQIRDAWRA